MTAALTRRLLREQIEDIWGRGRVELVDTNYAVDIVDHMPIPGQPTGRDALKGVVAQFRVEIADLAMNLHHVLAAGDHGVDVWTLTGRGPGGTPVRFSGIDMVRVAGGRISEMWHVEELAHYAMQIGASSGDFGAPTHEGAFAAPTLAAEYDPGASAIVPGEELFGRREHRNLAMARRHIEQVWARGQAELAHEVFHPDVVDHNPAPGQRPGIAGIVDVLGWLREAVPDLRMQIQCYVIDGDWIADRWIMTGTHTGAPLMGVPARGRGFRINGMDVARLDDAGLITDIWHCEEFAQLVQQVSHG